MRRKLQARETQSKSIVRLDSNRKSSFPSSTHHRRVQIYTYSNSDTGTGNQRDSEEDSAAPDNKINIWQPQTLVCAEI